MRREHKQETEARQALEATLRPGEELLAFTAGLSEHATVGQRVYVGLTSQRLILLPRSGTLLSNERPAEREHSLWLENVSRVTFSALWARLRVKVVKDILQIGCNTGYWKRRARELADRYADMPTPQQPAPAEIEERTQDQIRTLQELGFLNSAEELIEKGIHHGLTLGTTGDRQQLAERRFALRAAAAFLLVNVWLGLLYTLASAMMGVPIQPTSWIPMVIDVVIGINLWLGRGKAWPSWAIVRAVAGLLFYGVTSLIEGNYLEFLLQVAISTPLILALTGKSSRAKTWIAIGIYVLAYAGPTFFLFVVALLLTVP